MDVETNEDHREDDAFTPPRSFQHIDLFRTFETSGSIDRMKLINMINHLHFKGSPLFILLKHPVHRNSLLVKAHPEPCLGSQLTCRWDESYHRYQLKSHPPLCLVILYNPFMIIASLNLFRGDHNGFTLQLPEKSYALNQRRSRRYPCRDVTAELIQSGFGITGELMDFSASAFRIQTDPQASGHNGGFNPDAPASIRLFSKQIMIYSETCRCIRQSDDQDSSRQIVFASESEHIRRFPAKKIRNPRKLLLPSLTAVFRHPFFRQRIQRDIFDISTTGFSVRDKPVDDVFMPGMIIHDLSILLAGIPVAVCTAQILYRRMEAEFIQYGMAFLDMDIRSYSRINHVLGMNTDPRISVSTEVDMDALWEFLFQTGFIYPEKYGHCQSHRQDFIETYRKLYQENPEIARHITYEKNGRIYGHISMIRAYERSWLIQHHAARSVENKRAGLIVLRQMMLFLNGMYPLPSAKMDYAICYFRPENKFPNRVFGGFARDFNNFQACSLDLFAYLTLPVTALEKNLPLEWVLRESTPPDLWELEQFYRHHSGGLLMHVLRCREPGPGEASLEKDFDRFGFSRKCRFYSLLYQGRLKSFFIVDQSDTVINMSDLLNCIKVLITDPGDLPWEWLCLAVSKLGNVYNLQKATVLIYPAHCADSAGIVNNKRYQLWILNLRYSNQFMDYVQKNFRMKYE